MKYIRISEKDLQKMSYDELHQIWLGIVNLIDDLDGKRDQVDNILFNKYGKNKETN